MLHCTCGSSSIIVSQGDTINIIVAYTYDICSHLCPKWSGGSFSGEMARFSIEVQQLGAARPIPMFDCGDTPSRGAINDFNNGIPMIEFETGIRVCEEDIGYLIEELPLQKDYSFGS